MPFTGNVFAHLFDWEKDPQRQEKIVNSRLEAEFDGIDAALSTVHTRTVEKLNAARTYYVRTDGNDSNDGLSNSSSGAFLTIQKAINTISETLDIAGFTVTIQIGDGTYTAPNALKNVRGFAANGNLVIQGNAATPANVHVNVTGQAFRADDLFTTWRIKDMKISGTNAAFSANRATILIGNIDFGAATTHMACGAGNITLESNCAISGGAGNAWAHVAYAGVINMGFVTITLTTAGLSFFRFVNAQTMGIIEATSAVFGGNVATATGIRYNVVNNSVIQTNGGGANFFPGNAAGTSGSGGQYL